jgi:hypothetical protein
MKEPKSNLPYTNTIVNRNIINWNNSTIDLCKLEHEEDAEYIIQACNNFPKAVELLRKFTEIGSLSSDENLSKICLLDVEVDEFLKEIENV